MAYLGHRTPRDKRLMVALADLFCEDGVVYALAPIFAALSDTLTTDDVVDCFTANHPELPPTEEKERA